MNKRMVLTSILMTMIVSLVGISASAENVIINTSGTTPFLYEGHSYLPLKSTAGFLGAPLRWDAEKGHAVLNYKGEELVLTPNSLNALLDGQPVALSAPPIVVDGVTYVPMEAFKKFYDVPVAWDGDESEVKIKGPDGWGTVKAGNRAPWHGGPPPWAPAHGWRAQQQVQGVQLTSEQDQRIAEVREEARRRIETINKDGNLPRDERGKRINEARRAEHNKVLAELTPDQRRQFDDHWNNRPDNGKDSKGKSGNKGAPGSAHKTKKG